MQTLRMRKEHLPTLLEGLRAWGTLFAPVERGRGAYSLEPIDDVGMARPEALRTIIPFKKLLIVRHTTIGQDDVAKLLSAIAAAMDNGAAADGGH